MVSRWSGQGGGVSILLVIMPSSVLAHPVQDNGMGAVHVLTSLEHVIAFVAIGIVVSILMLFRRPWLAYLSNSLLLLILIAQGVSHGINGDSIFGVEVVFGSALLVLGAWRTAYVCYERLISRALGKLL